MGCRGRGRIGLVEGGWRKRVSIRLSPSPSSLLQWLPTLTHLRQPCPCSSSSPKSTSAQCRTLFIWRWPGTQHFFALFLTCTIYHSDSSHWSTSDLSSFTPHTCWARGLLLTWGINTYTVASWSWYFANLYSYTDWRREGIFTISQLYVLYSSHDRSWYWWFPFKVSYTWSILLYPDYPDTHLLQLCLLKLID